MPLYMDRHNLENVSAEAVAHAHAQDLAVEGKHGVAFRTYWFDARSCCAFCLIEAPSAQAAIEAHRDSHGLVPADIIEVDGAMVEAFLGRLSDPHSVVHSSKPIDEAATRIVMFTDIVNSTDMTARLGDGAAMDLVRAHDGIVRARLNQVGGREVKHLGDGIMAAFADPRGAVLAACGIQKDVAAFNTTSKESLNLRIGMHLGEPVSDNKDLFGATVQLAARICDDASIDAVVVSAELREALGDEFRFAPLGRRMLKGFKAPVPLFSVEWES